MKKSNFKKLDHHITIKYRTMLQYYLWLPEMHMKKILNACTCRHVYQSVKMHTFKIFELLGRDHQWTLRKKVTRVLLVSEVPTRGQHSMWTPVVKSQRNASKTFLLRSGHMWTLSFMSSSDSTHWYITAQNLSANYPFDTDRVKHLISRNAGWLQLLPAACRSNQECPTGGHAAREVSFGRCVRQSNV